ncbi:MAG: hypothetical protein ABR924_17770 [Terracidiphilus sp.]
MTTSFRKRILDTIQVRLFPSPVRVRHAVYSMVYSEDDAVSGPSARLLEVAAKALMLARDIDLQDVCNRMRGRFPYPDSIVNLWPGEHYRLLAALVQLLRPRLVIEIGTAEGLSALALLKYLPAGGQVVTFDIVPWRDYPRICLQESDFSSGQLCQITDDLGNSQLFDKHRAMLKRADLIFVDAAKDGVLEPKLVAQLGSLDFETQPLVVFDDIKQWNMLALWRELKWPKMDLTSLGHWCGTGLCEVDKVSKSVISSESATDAVGTKRNTEGRLTR